MAMAISDRGELLNLISEMWVPNLRHENYTRYVRHCIENGKIPLAFEAFMGEKQQGDTTYGNC